MPFLPILDNVSKVSVLFNGDLPFDNVISEVTLKVIKEDLNELALYHNKTITFLNM